MFAAGPSASKVREYACAGHAEHKKPHDNEIRFVPLDFGGELHGDEWNQQDRDRGQCDPGKDRVMRD
jgi:hypothetical protein